MLCLEYTRCSITIYRINERIYLKSDFVLKLSGEQIGHPDGVSGHQAKIKSGYYCPETPFVT